MLQARGGLLVHLPKKPLSSSLSYLRLAPITARIKVYQGLCSSSSPWLAFPLSPRYAPRGGPRQHGMGVADQ